jgi:predicted HNH restriction endonuclease
MREALRRWREANRATLARLQREYAARVRREAIILLGDKCAECGIDDERVLEIDHVNGDRPVGISGNTIIREVARGVHAYDVRLLCANCHTIKTREAGEYGTRTRY